MKSLSSAGMAQPEVIHNCPECSLWLPEGTLACQECHTIVYRQHLNEMGQQALAQEREGLWVEARATWQGMLAWLPGETEQAGAVQGRIALIDARKAAAASTREKWTKRLGPLAPVVFFLAKAKTFLFALLKFKFFLSFFAFFGIYWALFGWKFGLGFTVSILIHELGHYVAARRRGLKVDLPVFLPGLGAYVKWYSMGVSLETLSGIALAGPTAGLLAAVGCYGLYAASVGHVALSAGKAVDPGSNAALWGALAHTGAWLNLINLVPVLGLDGAQATIALNRVQRAIVLASAIAFFVMLQEGVFIFIALGMAWRLFTGAAPEKASSGTMVRYMMLLFLLGALMWVAPDARF